MKNKFYTEPALQAEVHEMRRQRDHTELARTLTMFHMRTACTEICVLTCSKTYDDPCYKQLLASV